MPLWPFNRSPKRHASAAGAEPGLLTEASRRFEGAIDWTADPFFRPTIGAFVDGRLQAIVATRRQATRISDGRRSWRCGFTFPAGSLPPSKERVELICMETGDSLAPPPPTTPGSRLTVADLVRLSATRATPVEGGGFPAFLALDGADQLSLLHWLVLDRPPTDEERMLLSGKLRAGHTTILGIRDRLLTSAEFRDGRMKRVTPPFGHWLAWSGLETATPDLVPASRSAPRVDCDRAIAERRLALVSLGDDASEKDLRLWLADHADTLAATIGPIEQGARRIALSVPTSTHVLNLGHLLAAMRCGPAAKRVGAAVALQPAASGIALFGPYLALACGTYELTLHLARPLAFATDEALLTLEVVLGEALLAGRAFAGPGIDSGDVVVGFVVPRQILPGRSTCEFRLTTSGGVAGAIGDVTLRRLRRSGTEVVPAPLMANWLPLLSLAPGVRRNGETIIAPEEVAGHVFYGPYRTMQPGRYRAEIRLSGARSRSGLQGRQMLGDVLDGKGGMLGAADFALREGESLLSLPFTITPPDEEDGLPSPIEIRLSKAKGASFCVAGVAVVREDGT